VTIGRIVPLSLHCPAGGVVEHGSLIAPGVPRSLMPPIVS
jgi:hypothetical protein